MRILLPTITRAQEQTGVHLGVIEAGAIIGHYEVKTLLGAGGMGEVYRARDTRLKRPVALKLLSRNFAQHEDRLRRFRQEAFAASALNHPNIITIYEIGDCEFGPFIATELVEGETLRRRLKRAPIEISEALDLTLQVASALAAAHSAGVTHRDIKPDNIMIRDDGFVKVLDFGLAKLVDKAAGELNVDLDADTRPLSVTAAGLVMGTLEYMSPEQARGLKVDARTDIWSLGVVIYELLAGRVPFDGATASDLIVSILDREPPPLALHVPTIPVELQKTIHKTLRKEKEQRYQTAEELRIDLGKVKQHLQLEAAIETSREFVASTMVATRHTVGRETELAELHTGFVSAATGRGLLLCVAGEPGIGKTTLIEEFLANVVALDQPAYIARGRSSERLAGTETYFPFLEALGSLLHREGNEGLTRTMKSLAPTWYLQVSHPYEDSVSSQIVDVPHASSQDRMKRELGAFLQEVSCTKPLIFFFDDLQWADVSTIELLTYLAGKFEAMRLLIVVAYRQSEMLLVNHPFLSVKLDLQGRNLCREMALEFLSYEEVERYLGLEFPGHEFPAEFAALIYAKTEGSPLFMVDLARYLRDRKVIERDQQRWILAQSMPDVERELPESVRSMIQRKIDQLSEDDRRLLIAGSVEGYEFNSAVVAEALLIEVEVVEARLHALDFIYGLVRLAAEQEFPDGALTQRYQFVHVLYQNALYNSLSSRRRASLSAAIAEALLAHYGEQSAAVASKLAFLFESARDWAHAADYFTRAAENAGRFFAIEDTITLSRRGLEMVKRLPDTTESARQELRFQIMLGYHLMATKGFAGSETMQAYIGARELCEQLGGESEEQFQVLFGLSMIYLARSEHQRAFEIAEQMLRLAESSRDPLHLLQAHYMLGSILHYLGELTRSLDHLERTIGFCDQRNYRSQLFPIGAHVGVMAQATSARVLWSLGYADRAREMVRTAFVLAEEVRHPMSLAVTLYHKVIIVVCCGDERVAQTDAEELISFSNEHGLPHYSSVGTIWRGWALAMEDQYKEGLAQMREGMAAYRAIGSEVGRTSQLALLAEALGEEGQPGEGLNILAEALTVAELTGERFYEAELHRLKGELLLMQAMGEKDRQSSEVLQTNSAGRAAISAAETCFLRAIDIARQQDAKSWELRAVMSLHRLRQKQGKQNESRQLLKELFDWFTEGFDTADLREARALLEDSSAAAL